MSKNRRISHLEIWWYELADDLRAERRNKIEEFNKILLENGIITEIIDSFGRKLKSAPNAVDYFHATYDKTGNIIDSDKHKEIRAIYSQWGLIPRRFAAVQLWQRLKFMVVNPTCTKNFLYKKKYPAALPYA